MPPRVFKTLILITVLLYAISPIDIVPDLLGPLGRFDDLIIFFLALWRLRSLRGGKTSTAHSARSPEPHTSRTASPWEILGLTAGAPSSEIDLRYRELIKQYHPDKVDHLGEELRRVAHEKTIEITRAYESLK